MKTVYTLVICFTLLQSQASGQKLQWSLPQKVNDRAFVTECVGENTGGLFIVKRYDRSQERNITMERYTDDMRRSISKVFLTHRNEYYIKTVLDSAGLKMIYATVDKDKKQTSIRLKSISFALGETGKDTTLFTVDGINPSQAMVTAYKMKMSPYVLLTYTNERGDYALNYKYILLDKDYMKQDSGTFSLQGSSHMAIEQASFNGEYVALLVREDVKTKVLRQGYRFYIYYGALSGGALNHSSLFNDSLAITEGLLKTDFKNNHIVFGGLFSTADSNYVKGYYAWRFDMDKHSVSERYGYFAPDIIAEMEGRKNRLRGIFNLRAGDLSLRGDGGMILTTEEYQETHENVTDINAYGVAQPNIRNFFYYQNLLVLNINPDFGLAWHTVIRKDQVTVNDNGTFSSYLLTVTGDKLVYVYNDLSRKDWNLSATEINEKGEPSSYILVKSQDYDGRMIPQYGDQVSNTEFVLPEITPRGIIMLRTAYQQP